jgi:hypothetical protein
MKTTIAIASLLLILGACSKDDIKIDPDNLLIGVWNYSASTDTVNIYVRSSEFSDTPGYKFNSDGTLTERNNSSFCGTPPIIYADYSGIWSVENDTLIKITVGYWGGTTTYRLDLEMVNSNLLKTISIFENK